MSLIVQELTWAGAALKSPLTAPLTLIATGLAYVAFFGHTGPVVAVALAAFLLTLLSLIDLKHGILPHTLNLALGLAGIVLAPTAMGLPVLDVLLGAPAAFLLFWLMSALSTHLANRPALGGGDLWLATALGPWLGASGLAPFLFILAVISLGLLLARAYKSPQIGRFAFGPSLALSGFLTMLYQDIYWKCIISFMN